LAYITNYKHSNYKAESAAINLSLPFSSVVVAVVESTTVCSCVNTILLRSFQYISICYRRLCIDLFILFLDKVLWCFYSLLQSTYFFFPFVNCKISKASDEAHLLYFSFRVCSFVKKRAQKIIFYEKKLFSVRSFDKKKVSKIKLVFRFYRKQAFRFSKYF
jgi:hypothetical protein